MGQHLQDLKLVAHGPTFTRSKISSTRATCLTNLVSCDDSSIYIINMWGFYFQYYLDSSDGNMSNLYQLHFGISL